MYSAIVRFLIDYCFFLALDKYVIMFVVTSFSEMNSKHLYKYMHCILLRYRYKLPKVRREYVRDQSSIELVIFGNEVVIR